MTDFSVRKRMLLCERLEPRQLLTVTVDTLADVVDPVDELTSLREAIALANDGETIDFFLGGTINLDAALGELLIDRPLTILGPEEEGIVLSGSGGHRIMSVDDGEDSSAELVQLIRLTLTGGETDGNGGGIFNAESLEVIDSVITGNQATSRTSLGGGIYSRGSLLVGESTVSENAANGVFQGGGGIHNRGGRLTIRNSTVSGNRASDGGGVISGGGDLVIASIVGSTINGNFASDSGGGVYLIDGRATIESSTISGNSADDSGGGFYNFNASVEIAYSTITDNSGGGDRGGGVAGNGSLSGMTEIRGSILADNIVGGDMMGVGFYRSSSDMFASLGHNLVGAGNVLDVMSATDLLGVDPALEPLADNGGLTHTHALLEGSPAVDAGDPLALEGTAGVPFWDQRDDAFRRVFDGDFNELARIDIGAYERNWPADLSVTKSLEIIDDGVPADDSHINELQRIAYTITAANSEASRVSATGVTVLDNLPLGLTIISVEPSVGQYDAGVWDGFSLQPGEAQTLLIEATVDSDSSGQELINIAVISGDQIDPNLSNNQAEAMIAVNAVDVSVTKTVSDETPNVDQEIVYTLVATNSPDSNNTATEVEVFDALPPEALLVSVEATEGEFGGGVWSGLTLDPGESQALTVVIRFVEASAGAVVVNTALISALETDPDLTNNEAAATATFNSVDLSVEKIVDLGAVNVGETLVYTLTAANSADSNAAATGVVVQDNLPSELSIVSVDSTEGSYDDGLWSGLELEPGEAQTLIISATLLQATSDGVILNTATISGDQSDSNLLNNENSATAMISMIDLSLTKTADLSTAFEGESVVFSVVVTNQSDATATGLEVLDSIPAGLIFVSAQSSAGSYDAGVWNGFDLAPGEQQTLVIQTEVDVETTGSTIVNMATVAADQSDPNLLNNVDQAQVSIEEFVLEVDLSIDKTVDDQAPVFGQQITYTIIVANLSQPGVTATGVEVEDILPSGLIFVSADATEGSYDLDTQLWTGLELASGETQSLTLTLTVESAGEPITNTATVAGDEIDPDEENNSDSVDVTPLFPGPAALAPLAGDFNESGAVDGQDLTDAPLGFASRFGGGLSGGDFLAWQRNLGRSVAGAVAVRSESARQDAVAVAAEAVSVDYPFAPEESASVALAADLARQYPPPRAAFHERPTASLGESDAEFRVASQQARDEVFRRAALRPAFGR